MREYSVESQGLGDGPSESLLRRLYYHPVTQVIVLALIFFMFPGLFNALNGLGAAGQRFFSGSINNRLGPRTTLFIGSLGYALYVGSFLTLNIHSRAGGFVIAAGAIQGLCAGMLWAAQGSLMLSYPTESQKGRFIGIFWAIFNMGAVVGAVVSLSENFRSQSNSVGNGTYIAFLALTLSGSAIPLAMADPSKVRRTDGSQVSITRNSTWKKEIYGLWVVLKTYPTILLLFPMFFASNWFYTWQFNDFNAAVFNIGARSLNNLVYWLSQIFGALGLSMVLDQKTVPRRSRAIIAWSLVFVLSFVVHIWAYIYQRSYSRSSIPPDASKMDILDNGYIPRIFLYMLCGVLDAIFQAFTFWLIGALSNDAAQLAHLAGFC